MIYEAGAVIQCQLVYVKDPQCLLFTLPLLANTAPFNSIRGDRGISMIDLSPKIVLGTKLGAILRHCLDLPVPVKREMSGVRPFSDLAPVRA